MIGRTAGIIALCAAALSAQQTVFRSGVTHVYVDVVVTDKDDHVVTGLTAKDFTITEGGREQTIADFEHISVPPASRHVDLTTQPLPPPDTFSNAALPHTARAIVFVLDDCSLRLQDIVPIKRLMTTFLGTLSPDDSVAFTYVGRSDLSQDFTRDVGLLARSAASLGAAFGTPCRRIGSYVPYPVTFALKNVISALAASRETRHVVIYISDGYKPDPRDPLPADLVEVFDAAKHAGVPIYAMDPRGLMAPDLALEGDMESQTPENRKLVNDTIFQQQQWLAGVAENTGGRGFIHNSNLTEAVDDLMTDTGSYYLLGYYPTPYISDGKFHPIDVKVTRPGLRVRARPGYTTEPPRPASAPPPRLADTLAGGMPGGDLELRAFAAPVTLLAKGARTQLTVAVSYPALTEGQSRVDDELDLAWFALDPDAKVRASGQNTIHVPLSRATRDALMVAINDALDLPKGQTMLRLAVSSRALGTKGTVHVPLDVPDASSKLHASPLVLGLKGEVPAVIVQVGPASNGLPFQPTTTRTFGAGQQVYVASRITATKSETVTAEIVLKQGGLVLRTIPSGMKPVVGQKDAVDLGGSLTLAGLAPGAYVLELTVRKMGVATVTRSVPFAVK